jgi:hypothetical protein
MKMSIGIFWGIFLILIGLSLIVKIVFHVDFPFIKIFFAFLFIYFGIKILTGGDFRFLGYNPDGQSVIFGEKNYDTVDDGKEYNVIFSGATFALRNMEFSENKPIRIKLNTIFGGSKVLVSKGTALKVHATTVFGGSKLPDENVSAFGSIQFSSDTVGVEKPVLEIESSTVFGGLQIRQK